MAVVAVVVLVVVDIIGMYCIYNINQYHAFGSFITVTRFVPKNLMTPQSEMHGFSRGVSSKWRRLLYPDNPPKGQIFLHGRQLHYIFGTIKFGHLLIEDNPPWMVNWKVVFGRVQKLHPCF